ncbi:MAG: DegV family protein [Lachnospiraceae bacterium]|nr:DegV family protein [Lachnospiraceae bacterium]
MAIRILTDSTSDFTPEEAKQAGIALVPLHVIFDQEEYLDGVTLNKEEFYQKLESTELLPQTSQPSPNEFLSHFEDAKEAGDDLIVITVSSKLSGTCQSALLAKDICEYNRIYIVDSLSVTLGLKCLTQYALFLKEAGKNAEQIVASLEEAKHRLKLFAVVDTLKYLKKGGRLSGTAALAGTLLNIKPIIKVEEGLVIMAAKSRGRNNAYGKIIELMTEEGAPDFSLPYQIGYTGVPDTLDAFCNTIQSSFPLPFTPLTGIGCTVGVHAGPGACGIAYFSKQ